MHAQPTAATMPTNPASVFTGRPSNLLKLYHVAYAHNVEAIQQLGLPPVAVSEPNQLDEANMVHGFHTLSDAVFAAHDRRIFSPSRDKVILGIFVPEDQVQPQQRGTDLVAIRHVVAPEHISVVQRF